MKIISNPESAKFESTYALIVRSEEKKRSRFEIAIYAVLLASTLVAVSQFSREAAKMPLGLVHAQTMAPSATQARA